MTRRERLERKIELRRDWAEKAEARSNAAYHQSQSLVSGIPLGQPILVGHHSEKRHRRTLERSDNAMRRSCEAADLAKHHNSRADGIADQLDRSIFSDDADAIERLGDRTDGLTAQRDRMKAINAYARKHGSPDGIQPPLTKDETDQIASHIRFGGGTLAKPYPSYALTNIGARIRTAQKRTAIVAQRQDRAAEAEAAGGIAFEDCNGYTRVTFAEKPDRDVLDALRAANYRWGGGSWVGPTAALPACLSEGR